MRKRRGRIGRIFLLLAAVAMIVAVMPLAGAAGNDVSDMRVIDLYADGRADAPDQPIKVGEAKIWDDGTNLYVNYEIDTSLSGGWCITKTHIAVAETYDGLPQTKKGNAIPGKFEFSAIHDPCETTVPYTIPMTDLPDADTFAIAVHANVSAMNEPIPGTGDLDEFEAALPDYVTMQVKYPVAGGDSYFQTTVSGGTDLDGTYDGWCVDTDNVIYQIPYTAKVYSSYELLPDGLVEIPENLDLVNWIINQGFVDTPSPGGYGNYTYGDVQRAIWTLVDPNSTSGLGSWSPDRVNEIITAAERYGEGFEPVDCGQKVATILQPVDANGNATAVQITIAQVTLIDVGIPCEYRGETAWGGDWGDWIDDDEEAYTGFEYEFLGKGWEGYITYTVGPVT
jgi:hypothetical protein